MSILKIFPIQDTTLYSKDSTANTGIDEILEVGAFNYLSITNDDIRRSLLLFDTAELRAAVAGLSGSVTASLRMFLASADNLAQTYTIEAYPVAQTWQNGLGKYADSPVNTGGASWTYVGQSGSSATWDLTTYSGSYLFTTGGGSWTTTRTGSQAFTFTSDKDVNLDISTIVNSWTASSGAQPNNGILVKLTGSIELNTGSYMGLKFYSRETHTIYPPHIELKWDDSSFRTGSAGYTTASKDSFILTATNNLGTFKQDAVHTFNFKTREQYPTRVFQTSSVYLDWQYLPSQSYWAIQDYKTKEMVVDFDTVATKLSTTPNGSSFTLRMNGLQPERSYKILVKSNLATGETVIKDNDIIFKVTQ